MTLHKDQTITLRLPSSLLERAEAIVEYLREEELTSARVSRSTALRYALERGLFELEEDSALKRYLRESIAKELVDGDSPEDVASRYRRHGIRLSEVLKIAGELESSPAKGKKRGGKKTSRT